MLAAVLLSVLAHEEFYTFAPRTFPPCYKACEPEFRCLVQEPFVEVGCSPVIEFTAPVEVTQGVVFRRLQQWFNIAGMELEEEQVHLEAVDTVWDGSRTLWEAVPTVRGGSDGEQFHFGRILRKASLEAGFLAHVEDEDIGKAKE